MNAIHAGGVFMRITNAQGGTRKGGIYLVNQLLQYNILHRIAYRIKNWTMKVYSCAQLVTLTLRVFFIRVRSRTPL